MFLDSIKRMFIGNSIESRALTKRDVNLLEQAVQAQMQRRLNSTTEGLSSSATIAAQGLADRNQVHLTYVKQQILTMTAAEAAAAATMVVASLGAAGGMLYAAHERSRANNRGRLEINYQPLNLQGEETSRFDVNKLLHLRETNI